MPLSCLGFPRPRRDDVAAHRSPPRLRAAFPWAGLPGPEEAELPPSFSPYARDWAVASMGTMRRFNRGLSDQLVIELCPGCFVPLLVESLRVSLGVQIREDYLDFYHNGLSILALSRHPVVSNRLRLLQIQGLVVKVRAGSNYFYCVVK